MVNNLMAWAKKPPPLVGYRVKLFQKYCRLPRISPWLVAMMWFDIPCVLADCPEKPNGLYPYDSELCGVNLQSEDNKYSIKRLFLHASHGICYIKTCPGGLEWNNDKSACGKWLSSYSLWTARRLRKGNGKREPVGMAKDFDFQMPVICGMSKLTIWMAITTTATNCEQII